MVSRSPSPNTLRAQSPSPRTPDPGSAHKKIPWVNPLGSPRHATNGNPQELPQRGRSSQKENDMVRGRSPVGHSSASSCCSKGAKNFMAPTFSAASKVVPVTEKRKVLSERNEVMRSSFTSSSSLDSLESLGSLEFSARRAVSASLDDLDLTQTVRRWDPVMGSEERLAHPPSSDSPAPQCTSLPPYDPETNFLSPRPRFLHYKPKPRAQSEDARLLEDLSSDSSGESPQKSEDAQSSITRKTILDDDDDAMEGAAVVGEVKAEEEESGATAVEWEAEEIDSKEVTFHSIEKPRHRCFLRVKTVTFMVLLTVASFCVTISDTPVVPSPASSPHQWDFGSHYAQTVGGVLRYPSVGGYLSRAARFGDSNFKRFAKILQHWSADTAARLSASGQYQDHRLLVPLNSTSVVDEIAELEEAEQVTMVVMVDSDEEKERSVTNHMEEPEDGGVQEEDLSLMVETIVEEEPQAAAADARNSVSNLDSQARMDVVPSDQAIAETLEEEEEEEEEVVVVKEDDHQAEEADRQDFVIEGRATPEDAVEITENNVADDGYDLIRKMSSESLLDVNEVEFIEDSSGADEHHVAGTESKHSYAMEAIVALFSALLVAATGVWLLLRRYFKQSHHQSAASTSRAPTPEEKTPQQPLVASTRPDSSSSNIQSAQRFLENFPTEVETAHESGPATSSSLHNVSQRSRKTSKRIVEEEDVMSHEGKPRRDSTASSASFGSFTTYERRSGKKVSAGGGGQDEVITPVRRSSRIRSQLTSP